uniref:NADH-ubiquinone oxidoreductase chain 3 n=1 Tax=Agathidium nigripenne TaxID=1586957 RepID=A0A343C4A8_9COLE|nr:NADH dehydrogenase subunit 3 [Agathidium nigripenne]
MNLLFIMSMILFMISMIMMILATLISKKSMMDREKSSPFECGFDPKSYPRISFSIHFFLIAMIFLIFDIEITLLIPLIISLNITNLFNFLALSFFFFFILLIGTYHEWNQGALTWIN